MRTDAPTCRRAPAGGLDLHLLEWAGDGPTVLLLHGFLDCGGGFEPLVRHLPAHWRILAPDHRGHGQSDRVPAGGYYHFADYVRDLRALVDGLGLDRFHLVGHSMGGSVSLLFAGTWPESVERLVLLEGLGPPADRVQDGPARMKRWLAELASPRPARSYDSPAAVSARLRKYAPGMTEADAGLVAHWLAEPGADGWTWRHDPLHRTRSPRLYLPSTYEPFARAVTAPTLLMAGGKSWYRYDGLEERRSWLADRRLVTLPDVGHMLHQEAPAAVAAELVGFLEPPG